MSAEANHVSLIVSDDKIIAKTLLRHPDGTWFKFILTAKNAQELWRVCQTIHQQGEAKLAEILAQVDQAKEQTTEIKVLDQYIEEYLAKGGQIHRPASKAKGFNPSLDIDELLKGLEEASPGPGPGPGLNLPELDPIPEPLEIEEPPVELGGLSQAQAA